jgi:hypothetical protein
VAFTSAGDKEQEKEYYTSNGITSAKTRRGATKLKDQILTR